MQDWLPPFASGKLTSSYKLLKRYLEKAREKGREDLVEKATLMEGDYRLLRETVGQGLDAATLIERLTEALLDRIDPEIASETLREEGIPASPDEARRIIARLLATWLVEAGEYWGMVRLREPAKDKHPQEH